jgi:thiol-disulfide isomerase/thioredoxin
VSATPLEPTELPKGDIMRTLPTLVLAGALLFAASLAQAQVAPKKDAGPALGDKPKFSYQTTDGKTVSPDTLKGRIIVLDFWATWCGPCMSEAPHMVQLQKDNADKGVALIGVSLDTDKSDMLKVAKDKGLLWPQIFDGGNWSGPIAKAWGITSIPRTFILSPAGEIVWIGHPAMIDAPLAAIIKKYPTLPAMRARALEVLADALKFASDEGNPEKALAALADLPEGVTPDAAVSAAAAALSAKLTDDQGQEALKANESAAKMLASLGPKTLAKTPPKPAVTILSTTAPKPAGIAPALLDARLAQADKDRAANRPVDAFQKYKWVVDKAPGTPQADAAAKQAAELQAAPGFADLLKKSQRDQEAASLLWEAATLEKNDKPALARPKYQKIVTDFKDTPAATEAASALDRLK